MRNSLLYAIKPLLQFFNYTEITHEDVLEHFLHAQFPNTEGKPTITDLINYIKSYPPFAHYILLDENDHIEKHPWDIFSAKLINHSLENHFQQTHLQWYYTEGIKILEFIAFKCHNMAQISIEDQKTNDFEEIMQKLMGPNGVNLTTCLPGMASRLQDTYRELSQETNQKKIILNTIQIILDNLVIHFAKEFLNQEYMKGEEIHYKRIYLNKLYQKINLETSLAPDLYANGHYFTNQNSFNEAIHYHLSPKKLVDHIINQNDIITLLSEIKDFETYDISKNRLVELGLSIEEIGELMSSILEENSYHIKISINFEQIISYAQLSLYRNLILQNLWEITHIEQPINESEVICFSFLNYFAMAWIKSTKDQFTINTPLTIYFSQLNEDEKNTLLINMLPALDSNKNQKLIVKQLLYILPDLLPIYNKHISQKIPNANVCSNYNHHLSSMLHNMIIFPLFDKTRVAHMILYLNRDHLTNTIMQINLLLEWAIKENYIGSAKYIISSEKFIPTEKIIFIILEHRHFELMVIFLKKIEEPNFSNKITNKINEMYEDIIEYCLQKKEWHAAKTIHENSPRNLSDEVIISLLNKKHYSSLLIYSIFTNNEIIFNTTTPCIQYINDININYLLMWAINENRISMTSTLLQIIGVNCYSSTGKSPMMYAINSINQTQNGFTDLRMIELLLQNNSNIYQVNMHQRSSLDFAVSSGNHVVVDLLLKHDSSQFSLELATNLIKMSIRLNKIHNCVKMLETLLSYTHQKGYRINVSDLIISYSGNFLLQSYTYHAINHNCTEVIQALWQIRDHLDNTTLHIAASQNRPYMIRMISYIGQEFGINLLKVKNREQHTPLEVALSKNHQGAIQTLLEIQSQELYQDWMHSLNNVASLQNFLLHVDYSFTKKLFYFFEHPFESTKRNSLFRQIIDIFNNPLSDLNEPIQKLSFILEQQSFYFDLQDDLFLKLIFICSRLNIDYSLTLNPHDAHNLCLHLHRPLFEFPSEQFILLGQTATV